MVPGGCPGGEDTGDVAPGKFPKVFLRVYFFLEKSSCSILPLPLYKEEPILSHSPPLQLDQGLSRSGPHTAQLSTLPSLAPTASVGLPLHPYSPPCDFKQPGLCQCCSNRVSQGKEPLTRVFPRSPVAGLVGAKPGAAVALVPTLVPGTFLS